MLQVPLRRNGRQHSSGPRGHGQPRRRRQEQEQVDDDDDTTTTTKQKRRKHPNTETEGDDNLATRESHVYWVYLVFYSGFVGFHSLHTSLRSNSIIHAEVVCDNPTMVLVSNVVVVVLIDIVVDVDPTIWPRIVKSPRQSFDRRPKLDSK